MIGQIEGFGGNLKQFPLILGFDKLMFALL
jgi:hypothetical protein